MPWHVRVTSRPLCRRNGMTTTFTPPRHPPRRSPSRPAKTWPGGVEAVQGIDFEVAPGEVFGLLGPNGAGQVDDDRHAHHDHPPDVRPRRAAATTSPTDPIGARAVSAVVFQDAVVDKALTGRRNLQIHARLWGVAAATREPRIVEQRRPVRPHRPPRSAGRDLQRWAAAAARDRQGLLSNRRSCSSTSRPSASTRASARVARPHRRPARPLGRDRRADDPLPRRGGAAVRPRRHHARGSDRRARHAGRLLADLGDEVLELRVDGDPAAALRRLQAAGRRRRRCVRRRRHASPSRCTTGRRAESPRLDRLGLHVTATSTRRPPSTTSTSASPATGSPPTPQPEPTKATRCHSPPTPSTARNRHHRPHAHATTAGTSWVSALRTLTARRFALSARTPREILVPLLTPVLFALVIAPALDSIGPSLPGSTT